MKELHKIALRQNAIYLPGFDEQFSTPKGQTLLFVRTLGKHGFSVSERLLHALNATSDKVKKEIVAMFQEVLGTKLNWTPLVKNWEIPTNETIYDHWITAWYNEEINELPDRESYEYYSNKVYDYELFSGVKLACGHIIPEGTFPIERYNGCPFCGTPFVFEQLKLEKQGSKLKMLDLWTDTDAENYLKSLLSSKTPLDATQVDSLKILLKHIAPQLDTEIQMKETLMLVIDELISQGKESECSRYFKSPTDILRYLWYKKTGFLQIIEPKTIIKKISQNHRHISGLHDLSIFAKIASRENLKLKYSRKEGKMVACWLNNLPLSAEKIAEQMHPKRGMWVRFIRALRLAEYSKKAGFEKLKDLLDIFYNQVYEVEQARINHFRLKYDAENTFLLLKKRPGLFARSLFSNMLWFGAEVTLNAFKEIIDQVPMRLLLTLNSYSEIYFRKETSRSIKTIVGTRVNVPAHQLVRLYYSEEDLKAMRQSVEELCLFAFKKRFQKEESDFQHIYIEPSLYQIPLPIGDRSQNIQDFEPTLMGEIFPLEGDKIRLFMQWGEGLPAQHLDMDLSCFITYEKGVQICNYANLTPHGCKHSGDIRSIPHKIGTAEYIEIDVVTLQKFKAQYVSFTCNAYSVGGITPNLVVGWMDSKHRMKVSENSGVAYDPSCVIKQVRISQPLQKGLVFGVLDVQQRHIIWLEMPFDGQTVGSLDKENVSAMLQKLNAKITVGKLLKIKAKAQGWQIEETPETAQTIYDIAWARNLENITKLFVD